MKLDEIECLKCRAWIRRSSGGCTVNHCNVELEIQDIVFPIQKRADNFFVGSLALKLGVNLVIDSWLQTVDLVLTCLIRLERPDDIGLHVLQEHSRARKRFAPQ